MQCVVLGASGMLGSDIVQALTALGWHVTAFTRAELDITNWSQLKDKLSAFKSSQFLINCAAYTRVDECETNIDLAKKVNETGPQHLANFCADVGMTLVHFSTDYVFDGTKATPYLESDSPNPINVYGETKLKGEQAIQAGVPTHYIFRLQWLYGRTGPHFIQTILDLAKRQDRLQVVSDQIGSPSWTQTIAESVGDFLSLSPEFGTYHLTNQGYTSWYGLAQHVLAQSDQRACVEPVLSSAYPRPAKRPLNGQLDLTKFQATKAKMPPDWVKAVNQYLAPCLVR